jgi:hypothetical protein
MAAVMQEPDWDETRERIEACKTEVANVIAHFVSGTRDEDGIVVVTALSEMLAFSSVTIFGHRAAVAMLREVTHQLATNGPFE